MGPRWPSRVDLLVAFVVGGAMVGTVSRLGELSDGARAIDGWAIALHAVCAVAVFLTRLAPIPAVLVVASAFIIHSALGYPPGPIFSAGPGVLLLLTLSRGARRSWGWALVILASLGGGLAFGEPSVLLTRGLISIGWASAAILLAEVIRGRWGRAEEARRRADEEAERERVEERLRIARDLHDGVAHALSVIAIQARVAGKDASTPAAKAALAAITDTSRSAMTDLGTLVTGLRDSAPAPRSPVGSLEQVPRLVAAAESGGGRVRLIGPPAAGGWPGPVGAAAYRVVQESLTNARRHAPGAGILVEVDTRERLRVTVTNERPTSAPPAGSAASAGLGLVGMRERVEATGGRLRTGATPDGGWSVEAVWPEPTEAAE